MRSAPLLFVFASLALTVSAQEPCAEWSSQFGPPGLDGAPTLLRVLEVGGVEKLFVSGSFVSAGNLVAGGTAFWDGQEWEVGATQLGLGESIRDLVAFDDGSGPAFYAAGRFQTVDGGQHVGRWDGTQFFDVGGSIVENPSQGFGTSWVEDLAVFDDGSGPALYACGYWFQIGGQAIEHIARWDGTSWTSVGAVTPYGSGSSLAALCVFDDGSGPALYVGGNDTGNGLSIMKWDGANWSQVGAGFSPLGGVPYVRTLVVHDDGSGPALYAGGSFTAAGGAAQRLARWDGASWSAVGPGLPSGIFNGLYSWGSLLVANGMHFWDGASWSTPSEVPWWGSSAVMSAYDDGMGSALFVGGSFLFVGEEHVANIARFDGVVYEALDGGLGSPKPVDALAVYDDGSGPKLAADVRYNLDWTVPGEGVSVYGGGAWTELGGTTAGGDIEALEAYGGELFAGGDFDTFDGAPVARLAAWDGSSWNTVGGAFTGRVRGLQVLDDGAGERLFACGKIISIGGVPMSNVAAWDGTAWASIGTSASFDTRVNEVVVFDDGTGAALHAGGTFTEVEGQQAGRVARWTGSAWQPVGVGLDDWVNELVVHDDGSGPALFAGGRFSTADGQPAANVARWDGTSWTAVGAGLPDSVKTLEVVDLGFGPVLFAGGKLGNGSAQTPFFQYWDGVAWTPYEQPLSGSTVLAVEAWDDPTTFGPDAFLGGKFHRAGDQAAMHVAQLQPSCPCDSPTYCTAKQNSLGCYPAIAAGGSNSLAAGDLTLGATGVLSHKIGILIWSRGAAEQPFQGGTLCVEAPVTRTPVQSSGGNPPPTDCSGSFSFAFDPAYVSSKGLAAGDVVHAQYWSRDGQSTGGSSLSDAVRVLLCP